MLSKDLIEQATREAIKLGAESPGTEFKGSAPFKEIQLSLAKAAQGMANNRDGGLIVVGVLQKPNNPTVVQGVEPTIAQTYDPEIVRQFINKYASPAIETQTIRVELDGKTFIAVAVPPFGRSPTVCRKSSPPGVPDEDTMRPGDFFIRPSDILGTRKVQTAAEMEDLLQLAATRRASELIKLLFGSGLKPEEILQSVEQSAFDKEVSDIDKYL